MQIMTQSIIKKYYKLLIIGTPIFNVICYPILLTLNCLTGKYGYQIATVFIVFSVFLGYFFIEPFRRFKANNNFTPLLFIILFYGYLIYINSKIAIQAYLNNGWIPCDCPTCP